MNIFKIKPWVWLFLFTLPSLFFSENPYILSGLLFAFFLLYFFLLRTITVVDDNKSILLRNRIECLILLAIYAFYPVSLIVNKGVYFNDWERMAFSLIYFGIFIDLSFGYTKLFLRDGIHLKSIGWRIIIFLCLLIPPLGIYYLRYLYIQFNLIKK